MGLKASQNDRLKSHYSLFLMGCTYILLEIDFAVCNMQITPGRKMIFPGKGVEWSGVGSGREIVREEI